MVPVSLSPEKIAGTHLSVIPSWKNKMSFIYSHIHPSPILLSAYYDSGTVLDVGGLRMGKI